MPQPTPPPPDDPAAPRRAGVPAPRTPPVAGRSPGEATGDPHPVVALLAAVTDVGADRAPARPVVVLVTSPRATDGPPVSASVHAVLDAASPRIPHALVDPTDHDDDLRRLLDAAVRQFERPRAGWPPLPFPRYRDVATIADLRLPAHGVDRRVGALRAALGPGAGGSARVTEPIVSILTAGGTGASLAAGQAGGPRLATALYYVGVALLAAVLVLATRRLRQVLGPLWRLRRVHRALTDGDGGSALAAATTWTADAVDSAPDPDTARADRDRALAAAFLCDLRAAYRRPWLAPRDWRTAYPVLVLVDRPRSAALAALREAHARDPRALTVLTERTAPRSRARPAAGWEAYRTPWRDGTDPHRPWELALGAAAARSLAAVTAGPAARPARRWERVRNRYAAALVVTVLALAAGGVAHRVLVWSCRPGVAGENVEVDAGEEIGYRFCGRPFGGSASRSAPYQRLIFAENRRVDALRAADPRRPLLTLVVLTALTAPRADSPHSQVGESEDLAGVYAAQHGTNHTADGPLLRVVVANAGAASYKIEQAAALLRELLEADPSVFAGVVTLDSRYAVQQALRRLDSPRFAMITPTMTADGFGSPLPHFFQMIAPNAAQARLVRAYVDAVAPGARLVDVYGTPADGDLYVTTLRTALRAAFGPARFASLEWFRSSEREPRGAKDRLRAYCGRAGHVLFFGGRYTDFGDFAWDLVDTCNGRVPLVIADDSTSRFIVDRRLAATAPPGLAVVMATKGVLLSCRRLLDPTFAQAGAGEAGRGLAPRKQFRTDVQQALRRCLDAGAREQGDEFTDLTGGWAATAYDAVRLLLWADRQLRHDTPRETRADGMVRLLAGAGPLALGVNSPIQFDARRVTDTRRTSLVCLRDLSAAAATHAPGDVAVEVMRGGAAYPTDGAAPEPVTCPPPPGARTGS